MSCLGGLTCSSSDDLYGKYSCVPQRHYLLVPTQKDSRLGTFFRHFLAWCARRCIRITNCVQYCHVCRVASRRGAAYEDGLCSNEGVMKGTAEHVDAQLGEARKVRQQQCTAQIMFTHWTVCKFLLLPGAFSGHKIDIL